MQNISIGRYVAQNIKNYPSLTDPIIFFAQTTNEPKVFLRGIPNVLKITTQNVKKIILIYIYKKEIK